MCHRNKEVTEAGKLAHISFFEIRPIIFSLKKDAKLGRPMHSKQKIIERYIMKVLSASKHDVLQSPGEHKTVYYLLPSKSKYF